MGRPSLNAEKTFLTHIEKLKNECWRWTREIHNTTGYGRFASNNREWNAHRFSYIYYKGNIPHRFHVHHICNNRWCVNPKHLKAISAGEHCLSGNGYAGINSRKTYCKNGHEFTKENTYIHFRKNGRRRRNCKICRRASVSKFQQKHQKLPPLNFDPVPGEEGAFPYTE